MDAKLKACPPLAAGGLFLRALVVLGVALLTTLAVYGSAQAVNPPPVQHYYVPLPEDQIYHALKAIYPSSQSCPAAADVANPIHTYISISVIADNTILYYDHWEDGFEIDVTQPQQATTQIWGDGNPANGAPPGLANDLIMADTVIVLNNAVNMNTLQSVIDFDGGDRISSSTLIAMTRAGWATGSSTLLAGAVEVYDTNSWGTTFESPVGENLAYNQIFEYSALVVMAAEDNTVVTVDFDGNGTFDGTTTLNQGQSYHLTSGLLGTISIGTKVVASAPVQVNLLTGDVCDTYESRWYTLFPTERWSSSYYNPVGTPAGDGTTVFAYNPGPDALTVQWETTGGAQPALTIPARNTSHVVVPNNSGSHFYTTDGRPFLAIAAVDSDGPANTNSKAEWGVAMVPERMLTPQIMVGWGAGRDPLSNVNPNENGSPVWVMPVLTNGVTGPVPICIDYNGDNAGPLIDSRGLRYDQLLTLNSLQSAKVFDSDGDQTGMMLYVCNLDQTTLTQIKLAAAWGQAPGLASADAPGLDLGTTAPPAASFTIGKAADLLVDADQDGHASPGDTLLYTVVIRNTARVPLDNVQLRDELPQHTRYITNTTQFNNNGTLSALADNTIGTAYPLDDGGVNLGTLPVQGAFTVTFQVQIDNPLPLGVTRIRNVAIATANNEEKEAEVETPIDLDPTLTIKKATNGEDADSAPGPMLAVGDPVTWTYVVRNSGPVTATNISVTDDITGVTPVYVSGDLNNNGVLEPTETWLYQATGVAVAGQYRNIGTVRGTDADGDEITAQDPSHYFGLANAAIQIVKVASSTVVTAGETVIYTYTVTNEGDVPLRQIVVTDDKCTPLTYVGGDSDGDTHLDLTETWRYTCSAVIIQTTTNIATVTGRDPAGNEVTDDDTATVFVHRYFLPIIASPLPPPPPPPPCPPPAGCPVPGLAHPKGMAVHEGRNLLYITSRDTDRLLVIDPQTNNVISQTVTGDEPWGVVVNENRERLYVSNYASGDVWVYDVTTLAVLAKVPVGANPAQMAILPALDTVFVTVRGNSRVAIIQGLTVTQDLTSGGSGPFGIAADAVNQRVFVSHRDSRHLAEIRQSNGVWQTKSITLMPEGTVPFALAYHAARNRLYVLYAASSGQWFVDLWKPELNALWGRERTLPVGDSGPVNDANVGGAGLVVNPTTGHIFNVNTAAGTLTVISGQRERVLTTITIGSDPFPVAVNSRTNLVFIGLRSGNALIKLADTFGE
ncbi:MAG: DUF11 domain-containing protein [Caldilineaceae bacterium]|nr:DUF11 domain-containing protein [Caldilineaceae bacterium]